MNPFGKSLMRNNVSVYADARKSKMFHLDCMTQLHKHWYWDMRSGFIPNCYCTEDEQGHQSFRGVIANHRRLDKKGSVALCVGYGEGYLDFVAKKVCFKSVHRIVSGILKSNGEVVQVVFDT